MITKLLNSLTKSLIIVNSNNTDTAHLVQNKVSRGETICSLPVVECGHTMQPPSEWNTDGFNAPYRRAAEA